jgi:hypothetical protein
LPPAKKIAGEIEIKNIVYFFGTCYFPFLKLKMCSFVQESAAILTPFYHCKNSFSKILVFFTDIVADRAVRYTW